MTWLEMANLLFDQSNSLSPRGAHLHLDTASWLRTWTTHQVQSADQAANHFARHRAWPVMEPEPACQLYFRCLFAIQRCIDAQASGSRPPSSFEAETRSLESLLIQAWHLEGLAWVERRYASGQHRGYRVYA